MSNNKAMKDLSRGGRRLGQQLHDLRIFNRLSIEEVHVKTGIPTWWIDAIELGNRELRLEHLYVLAKLYNRKVVISLEDR